MLRQNPLSWRYLLNLRPTMGYRLGRRVLSPEADRVVSELNRDGIAVTSGEALFGATDSAFSELSAAVDALESEHRSSIEDSRTRAGDSSAIGQKTFIHFLLGDKPVVDPASVFARFALHSQVLGICNAYLGMHSQLRYYNVWHTLANGGPARESQLWHRDRDDFLTCKVFVYLNDVDEGAGPFTYARRTHPKGSNHAEPPFTMEGSVRRSDDAQMGVAAPSSSWLKATGKRGTIIFADTRGYHKGGEARTSDRILYTAMFVSPASDVREMMTRPARSFPAPSSRAASLALGRYL